MSSTTPEYLTDEALLNRYAIEMYRLLSDPTTSDETYAKYKALKSEVYRRMKASR